MAIQFTPLRADLLEAVCSFNERMRSGKADTAFLIPEVAPEGGAAQGPIVETQFVALDGANVHGGIIEMDQPGWLDGAEVRAFNYQSPLSEAILDRKYGMVAVRMVKFMESRGDAVFIVGMGNEANPMPRMLKASGWTVRPIPFLFRVHRARAFLREMHMLNTTPVRRIASRVAGLTGVATLGLACAQIRRSSMKFEVRREKTWGQWANEIWSRCRENCSFAAARELEVLKDLYPSDDRRLSILVLEKKGNPVGWTACYDTQFKDEKYFGKMRLGCVLDCVAIPEAMTSTAIAADRELGLRGADLVWLNHSHAEWVRAFRSAGFLPGPSNYLLGLSKPLVKTLSTARGGEAAVHVTRGDGDGRANFVTS